MRSGTVALAIVVSLAGARIHAAPHGGGHRSAPPQSPHFSPPPTPHFSPPTAAYSHAASQGGYNSGFAPRTGSQKHSSTSGSTVNGKTKLHNLSNALQQNSQSNIANPTVSNRSQGRSNGQVTTTPNGPLNAGLYPQVTGSSGQGATTAAALATTTFSHGQLPITGELSLNTGTPAVALTSTNSAATPLGTASTTLMSHLSGGYVYPASGTSTSSHRYYGGGYGARSSGSRYYGNRNNNSAYFAQMRRLSQLVNALNSLSKGSVTGVSHTSRLRGALTGVVFGNGQPPYQTVNQLAMDLTAHLPKRTTPMMNTGQLARSLMVVMNGSGQNMGALQHALSSAHSILSASGVNQPGVQKIGADMMMVASWGNMANPIAQLP